MVIALEQRALCLKECASIYIPEVFVSLPFFRLRKMIM